MKIVYCSDLHIDITQNNSKLIPYIINYINEINPDVFIIAGDLANSSSEINSALKQFQNLKLIKIYIPGNHDLWIDSKNQLKYGKDSSNKYENLLLEISNRNDFHYPIFEPLLLNEFAFLGTVGWYDYSLKDTRLDNEYKFKDYDLGVFGNRFWADTKYSVWLEDKTNPNWKLRNKKLSNKRVFDHIFNIYKESFNKINKNIKNICIISHMAPFKECIIPKNDPDPFDAYEGSIEFGNFIKQHSYNKNFIVICGYRHQKVDIKINDNIRVIRAPFGYLDDIIGDYSLLIKDKIGFIDL